MYWLLSICSSLQLLTLLTQTHSTTPFSDLTPALSAFSHPPPPCPRSLASIWVWSMGGTSSQLKGKRSELGQRFLSALFLHEPCFWYWMSASKITAHAGRPTALRFPLSLASSDTIFSPCPLRPGDDNGFPLLLDAGRLSIPCLFQ